MFFSKLYKVREKLSMFLMKLYKVRRKLSMFFEKLYKVPPKLSKLFPKLYKVFLRLYKVLRKVSKLFPQLYKVFLIFRERKTIRRWKQTISVSRKNFVHQREKISLPSPGKNEIKIGHQRIKEALYKTPLVYEYLTFCHRFYYKSRFSGKKMHFMRDFYLL